ncbi:putative preprotein translocase, SecB subunit [Paenibacillus sp. NAIST15-1]|nr:putative preprotein translocase, SecB subunit [Paenibacillus sp. NAIST15-1]
MLVILKELELELKLIGADVDWAKEVELANELKINPTERTVAIIFLYIHSLLWD